jgi:Tol biopolymer transport system component
LLLENPEPHSFRSPPTLTNDFSDRIRGSLETILKSATFERTDRTRGLLRFVVESSLEGRSDELKESVIGVKVFSRPADYDPKADPVVRVSMGRLRTRLESYYEREGASENIRIVIPKGAYLPTFEELANFVPPVAAALPQTPTGTSRRKLVWGAVAIVFIAVPLVFIPLSRHKPPNLDRLRPFLTTGAPNNVTFAPNADTLAFDMEAPGTRHRNVYVQSLREASPTRITDDAVNSQCPAWSPDRVHIAFLKVLSADAFGIFIASAENHSERKLTDLKKGSTPWLSWSPDGRWLTAAEPDSQGNRRVILISASDGQRHGLTHPAPGSRGDSLPIFSRDGSLIAFRRTTPLSGVEDIFTVPTSGGREKRITFDGRGISGFTFLNDGALLFSSKRAGPIRGIWWLSPDRSRTVRITPVTVDAGPVEVSRDGRHTALVSYDFDVNIWCLNLDHPDVNHATGAIPLIASELPDSSPQFSPDGARLAFSSMRAGTDAIWTSRSDGGSPTLLMDGAGFNIGSQHWSPDSSHLVFEWHRTGRAGLFTISTAGGPPKPLLTDQFNNSLPVWSPDGSSIYFLSNRSGHNRVWRIPASGGAPVPIATADADADAVHISGSGDSLYYMDKSPGHTTRNIWRVALPSGKPQLLISSLSEADWANWALATDAIYFVRRNGTQLWEIDRFDLASGTIRTVYELQRPPAFGGGLAVSPDGKTLLFTQVDREGSRVFVQ